MDQTTEQKKKKEEEKKRSGFLANLVGKPASTSGGAAIPGLGGGSSAGSWGGLSQLFSGGGWRALFASGGLLSTKAGIVGALLVATAVFGGLGALGYKLFGPSAADRAGTTYSLFSPRPAEEQAAIEAERLAADGKSASLEALAAANQGSGDAQASDAQAGDASGGAVGDAAAPAAGSYAAPASPKGAGVGGNKAAKLGAGGKLGGGGLSKMAMGGGGGSGASMSLGSGGAKPVAGTGSLRPMGSPKASAALGRGKARGLGARRSAMQQARGALGDQRGATSSTGAGTTYDGGPRMIGAGGTSATDAGAAAPRDASTNPNPIGPAQNQFPDPPQPTAAGWATPWQEAMNMAKMAILAGVALLFVAGKLAKGGAGMTLALAYGLMGLAAVAGALAIKMGTMISQQPYGQQLQGGMFVAAGAALIASAGLMVAATAAGTTNTLLNILMVTSGAASLGLLAAAHLTQPKRYPPWKFQDGQAPDLNHRTTTSDGQQVGANGLFGMIERPKSKYGWLKDQLPC